MYKKSFRLIKISDTRGADIEKALSSDISDFEDAVVSAIAERQKAKYNFNKEYKRL